MPYNLPGIVGRVPGCCTELALCWASSEGLFLVRKASLGPSLPVRSQPWGLQPSAPTCPSLTAGKLSFLIPRASYSSERAESWEEITSPEGRASSGQLFFRAAFGANDLSFLE